MAAARAANAGAGNGVDPVGHAGPSGRQLCDAAIAGIVGSEALNVTTYLDIAVRARPVSSTPERTAGRLAQVGHVGLGPEDRAANRRSGLGPLLGYALGIAVPVAFTALTGPRRFPLPVAAVLLGGGVMLGSDGTMTALRTTDPRSWSVTDWLSDAIPHLVYGLAAAATLRRLGLLRRS